MFKHGSSFKSSLVYNILIFSGYLNDHRKLYENHLHVWRGLLPHHMKPCERGI